eukprot:CAMPEP_0175865874 /NCGR_PEP_ID=MMETSP0107_2-20121207/33896_1 /TAXON_ID=195067 ORGANISM="Goniomonas pacifica, Strain CCMP1869" /NCGR_SAMPLE_ID=MMETSP0107_2 /ASSEMBLY_ACC=CAM_ASM_000203 /LENGTH=223 /DNA_ID=CAMNT_0017183339 /DNA_START=179 /DNA_END=850 /DNA_ORIENTATION=+
MVSFFLTNTPATVALMSVVPLGASATALAVQNIVYRVIGTIPGPIIWGALLDAACIVEDDACDGSGCHMYSTWTMRVMFAVAGLIGQLLSAFFFYLSLRSFRPGGDPEGPTVEMVSSTGVGDTPISSERQGAAYQGRPVSTNVVNTTHWNMQPPPQPDADVTGWNVAQPELPAVQPVVHADPTGWNAPTGFHAPPGSEVHPVPQTLPPPGPAPMAPGPQSSWA